MKKLLLILILFLGIFNFVDTPKTNAACATSPVFTNLSANEGDVWITWSLRFRNNCANSYQYNFTGVVPSGWSWKFSGCATNDTTCWKSVPGSGSITVNFTVTRPVTATSGDYTVRARGIPSSGAGDSIALSYTVVKLPNCNSGCVNPTTCIPNSGTCGPGTQTCTHNTRTDGNKCFPINYTATCNIACPTATPTPTPTPRPTATPTPTPTPRPTATPTPTSTPAPIPTNTPTPTPTPRPTATPTPTPTPAPRPTATPTPTPTPAPLPTNTPTPTPTPKTTYACINNACTNVTDGSGYDTQAQCESNCKVPEVDSCPSNLKDLAPAGIPVGGLCMVNRMIQLMLNLLLITSIILAVLYLIWGGATWILSEGDKQKLAQARQRITLAVIGLVIVFVSFAVLKILQLLFKIG